MEKDTFYESATAGKLSDQMDRKVLFEGEESAKGNDWKGKCEGFERVIRDLTSQLEDAHKCIQGVSAHKIETDVKNAALMAQVNILREIISAAL